MKSDIPIVLDPDSIANESKAWIKGRSCGALYTKECPVKEKDFGQWKCAFMQ